MFIPCLPSLRQRLIAVAQEAAAPDLLIRGARIWNAYTGEILPGDIAVCADRIAKVGPWSGPLAAGTELIEADGRVAVPGYIEPHTHPGPFASPLSLGEAAVCRGTTCLVYDELTLHLAMGTERLLEATRAMSAASLPHLKINDGHFAGASPRRLAALSNAGIHSCHEAINSDEVLERLRQGLWVLLRNSSLREDLAALLPALDKTAFHDRLAYTTDGAGERHVAATGLIEHLIAMTLAAGVAANLAYRMATLNPAGFLGLDQDLGAVVAGRIADINLLADMAQPMPELVLCRGRLAARPAVRRGRARLPHRSRCRGGRAATRYATRKAWMPGSIRSAVLCANASNPPS